MKVALVHEYLIRFGGAERVFLSLANIFKKADIFTLLYDKKRMDQYFGDRRIKTSFLQKMPLSLKKYRWYAPLFPAAVESLDLREYDLVISSSSAFIKGLVLRPKTIHICYCHNPARFLWDWAAQYDAGPNILKRLLFHYLRLWDRSAANRVDYFIANSKITSRRIRKFYGRDSAVIYPPVVISNMREVGKGAVNNNFNIIDMSGKLVNIRDFYLIVSQLSPYKKIDIAIDAFNKLELPLIIIGEGRDKKRLQRMAGPNIKFLGWLPDEQVSQYYQDCRAFIFPGEDDFGIAPVEAMSYGKPVLAFRKGGATETIIEGVTGEFFDDATTESLADGVRRLLMQIDKYSPLLIRKWSEKFSQDRFDQSIKESIISILQENKIK